MPTSGRVRGASTSATGGALDAAQAQAASVAETAQQGASKLAGTALDQAGGVLSEATAQGRNLAREAQQQLVEQAQQQTHQLSGNLRRVCSELQTMAGAGESGSLATTVLQRLAARGSGVADHLEERGPGGLLDEVQSYARRRPGAFLLAALAGGLVVGRMAKGVKAAGDGAAEADPVAARAPYPAYPVTGPGSDEPR